jgi:hypothetical protein
LHNCRSLGKGLIADHVVFALEGAEMELSVLQMIREVKWSAIKKPSSFGF